MARKVVTIVAEFYSLQHYSWIERTGILERTIEMKKNRMKVDLKTLSYQEYLMFR
ncbi:hypothetical protein D3C76_751170 [compost metagenome]